MSSIKRLRVLAENFAAKLAEMENKYGGKGPFELPNNHKAALQVPKGGSCCANCKFVDAEKHECKSPYYIKWNGNDPALPDLPLDEICSDWWNGND